MKATVAPGPAERDEPLTKEEIDRELSQIAVFFASRGVEQMAEVEGQGRSKGIVADLLVADALATKTADCAPQGTLRELIHVP